MLLKQLALAAENSFYISLDTFQDGDLFDLIKNLNSKLGFDLFLLDEIHVYWGYNEQLKKIEGELLCRNNEVR